LWSKARLSLKNLLLFNFDIAFSKVSLTPRVAALHTGICAVKRVTLATN
jgi:hypothetical protein